MYLQSHVSRPISWRQSSYVQVVTTVAAILGALRHYITHPGEKVEEARQKEDATVRNFIDACSPDGLLDFVGI